MTLLLEEPVAADELGAQLLFKEARRRRRGLRILRTTIVMVVVASLVGLGLAFHLLSGSTGPSVAITAPPRGRFARTGVTLVYAFDDLRVLDADSGSGHVLPLPAPYGGSRDLGMVLAGTSLVLDTRQHCVALSCRGQQHSYGPGSIGRSVARSKE